MVQPITKKVHAQRKPRIPVCETCKKPIGSQCNCSSGYIHVRGDK